MFLWSLRLTLGRNLCQNEPSQVGRKMGGEGDSYGDSYRTICASFWEVGVEDGGHKAKSNTPVTLSAIREIIHHHSFIIH
jgi:hypothetical protein